MLSPLLKINKRKECNNNNVEHNFNRFKRNFLGITNIHDFCPVITVIQ